MSTVSAKQYGQLRQGLCCNGQYIIILTSTGKGELSLNLRNRKTEKSEEKCMSENDMVIAPKHEPPICNLNLPKAWYSFISHTQKSV